MVNDRDDGERQWRMAGQRAPAGREENQRKLWHTAGKSRCRCPCELRDGRGAGGLGGNSPLVIRHPAGPVDLAVFTDGLGIALATSPQGCQLLAVRHQRAATPHPQDCDGLEPASFCSVKPSKRGVQPVFCPQGTTGFSRLCCLQLACRLRCPSAGDVGCIFHPVLLSGSHLGRRLGTSGCLFETFDDCDNADPPFSLSMPSANSSRWIARQCLMLQAMDCNFAMDRQTSKSWLVVSGKLGDPPPCRRVLGIR